MAPGLPQYVPSDDPVLEEIRTRAHSSAIAGLTRPGGLASPEGIEKLFDVRRHDTVESSALPEIIAARAAEKAREAGQHELAHKADVRADDLARGQHELAIADQLGKGVLGELQLEGQKSAAQARNAQEASEIRVSGVRQEATETLETGKIRQETHVRQIVDEGNYIARTIEASSQADADRVLASTKANVERARVGKIQRQGDRKAWILDHWEATIVAAVLAILVLIVILLSVR